VNLFARRAPRRAPVAAHHGGGLRANLLCLRFAALEKALPWSVFLVILSYPVYYEVVGGGIR